MRTVVASWQVVLAAGCWRGSHVSLHVAKALGGNAISRRPRWRFHSQSSAKSIGSVCAQTPVVLVQNRCQYMEANPAFCELDLFVAIPVNETIYRTGMNEPMKMEQGPLLFSHHCAMRSKAVVHP